MSSKFLSEGDAAYSNVYELASKALQEAQQEIRDWRIRAEDAEKNLEELNEQWSEAQRKISHLVRLSDIHNQIHEQKELAIAAYKNMVYDLQGAGIVARQSEEIVGLQTKLKEALACVPRGDNDDGFTFKNGDTVDYGSACSHTEFMVSYWQQALPLAMSCINRVHAMLHAGVNIGKVKEVIEAAKHALGRTHERTQVREEICLFSGKGSRHHWMQEEDDG